MKTRLVGLCLVLGLPVWAGCSYSHPLSGAYMAPNQQESGMAVILPGIEGKSFLNERLRDGLTKAGTPYALPIWQWGSRIPIMKLAMNEMDVQGNRVTGMELAIWIARYQDQYPGRPVYLVGHSGGGGIAVFAAEALGRMSGKHKLQGMVLLSPSLSANYDLTAAINVCEKGVVSFYNEGDVGLLWLGTTIIGNVDGGHGASAGRTGFRPPGLHDDEIRKAAYHRLYQVETSSGLAGIISNHTSDTQSTFVRQYVAPWILAASWPPPGNEVALNR
jgi:pimeloyl-ACP methyl ester carboxylesterase